MTYEDLGYWKEENWGSFFSSINRLTTEHNPVVRIRKKLEEEWEGEPAGKIYNQYDTHFQPEIRRKDEGKEERVKPWFLKFFNVGFKSEADYDGFVFRYESGRNINDLTIDVPHRNKWFRECAIRASDTVRTARKADFNIESPPRNDISMSDLETVRDMFLDTFNSLLNLTCLTNELMFFAWTLSNGAQKEYIDRAYPKLDRDLLTRLGFKVEEGYDSVIVGDSSKPAYRLLNLHSSIVDYYDIKNVASVLGFETPQDPMKAYYDKAVPVLKNTMSEKSHKVIEEVIEYGKGYSSGFSYVEDNKSLADYVSNTSSRAKTEFLSLLSPAFFLGVIEFRRGKVEGWRNIAKRW